MKNEKKRHRDGKFRFLRFVVKQKHSGQRTRAAAEKSREQKRRLGDAPSVTAGKLLIGQHKTESKRIDYKQIDKHKKILSGG